MKLFNHFKRNWTSKQHQGWWEHRKIDWNKEYLSTWNHLHRQIIAAMLAEKDWISLWELGCGPGPNLIQIIKKFPNRQVGGSDINPEAIEIAGKLFQGGHFEVCPNHDIMGSDNFTDIMLADRTLMYSGPLMIKKVIKEIKRCTRQGVIIVEYDTESLWEQLKFLFSSGMYAHNYEKLLKKEGFYDIVKYRMPIMEGADWPQKKMLKIIYGKCV